MLIIKLCVNLEQIDEIHVQRVSGSEGGWCRYAVRKPPIPGVLLHYYPAGAVALAAVVLSALAEAGYGKRGEDGDAHR